MIRFKYIPNSGLMDLIQQTVPNYHENYLYGILREEDRYQLRYKGVFLVCSIKEDHGLRVYDDPTVVIAKNEFEATSIFYQDTEMNGSIMCRIEDRANKLAVLPL